VCRYGKHSQVVTQLLQAWTNNHKHAVAAAMHKKHSHNLASPCAAAAWDAKQNKALITLSAADMGETCSSLNSTFWDIYTRTKSAGLRWNDYGIR
jgi:hypothetical protein